MDGFLAGIWQLTESGGRATLTVEAFGGLTPGQRAEVAEEGERVLAVMGMGGPYDIRFGSFSGPGA